MESYEKENNYYQIPISMGLFIFWLIITILFTLITAGTLFFLLIIPIIVYFQLKNTKYKYNDKEIIIDKGLIFKTHKSIALNKIEEVNIVIGLMTLMVQARPISLMNIKSLKKETNKFIQNWNQNR